MIYVNVDVKDFAEHWQLPLDRKFECPMCFQSFDMNIPVYTQASAGLVSKDHGCEFMQGFIGTPRTKEALAFWDKIV